MRALCVVINLLVVLVCCLCSAPESKVSPRNCFVGISTGPPSKVALLLSSFSTHISSPDSVFVLLSTRASEHESFFAHLQGRVMFVSIDFPEADLPLICMKRFFFYLEFLLSSRGRECVNVMYTDTYDVFFQGDPFTWQRYTSALTFTTESSVIGDEIWNAQWIYNCYGLNELQLIHNKTIANGGVAFGPYGDILSFTGHLLDEFESRSFFGKPHPGIDGSGLFRYGSFISSDSTHSCWTDQGFLNHLLHVVYPVSDVTCAAPSNFDNAVFTVGHNTPELHFRWQDGVLIRLQSDGSSDVPTMVLPCIC